MNINDDDRCLRQKQGGVVGAAFLFFNGLILYVDGGILAYIGKQPG